MFSSIFQIYWPAPVDWREECNWAGKDITVSPVSFLFVFQFLSHIESRKRKPFQSVSEKYKNSKTSSSVKN